MGIPTWRGTPSIKGATESARMALLTFSLFGVQFTWGLEMTYCTPYLLQLGLTKSKTSLVWIAGPLSGLIMQPVVGMLADRSTSRFGRRRPVMILGSIVVALCLFVLGWTKEIVGLFLGADVEEGAGGEETTESIKAQKEFKADMTILVAVLSIYAIDFAINAVMSCCRSLVVDTLPVHKQQLGSAWASRMAAVGGLIGYAVGSLDLSKVFGNMLGDSQFKRLCIIAAFALLFAVGVTSWGVTERAMVSDGKDPDEKSGILELFRNIFMTTMNLPVRIQSICWIQFWSWIGWFPFLFYSTTWVGELYLRYDAPEATEGNKDTLGAVGRVGSMSLVIFSIITTTGSILLPLLIKSPEEAHDGPRSSRELPEKMEKAKPSLLTAWWVGHWMFAGALVCAPFIASFKAAATIIAVCGIPSALANWAPFTFMGVEINRLSAGGPESRPGMGYRPLSNAALEMQTHGSDHAPGSPPPTPPRLVRRDSEEEGNSAGELSGIYLGILNLFTTLPQFVGTFISMVVFTILEPGKSPELAKEAHPDEHHSTDGPNAIAVCLFIGGCASLCAAEATRRLRQSGF